MINIYDNSSEIEKIAKEKYLIPDFLMMENAAEEICKFIKDISKNHYANSKSLLIICGKGNNGGDGFAVARKLQENFEVFVYCPTPPVTFEANKQFDICKKLDINFINEQQFFFQCNTVSIILDCLYGTGFHGETDDSTKKILSAANNSKAIKIACDVPSGFYFNADHTITMGELKIDLFSDKAKNSCGKIHIANLGLSSDKFLNNIKPEAKLITPEDARLPYRKDKSVHKGNFGHTIVFSGEKSGASIIAASASLNFGTGLSSLYITEQSNVNQFKISPELMLTTSIPEKTSSVLIGSGLGTPTTKIISTFTNWFENKINPSCVIDADMFYYQDLSNLLSKLSSIPNSRIVLTPHPKELSSLLDKVGIKYSDLFSPIEKIKIGKEFNSIFPNCVLVMKSANTFIAAENEVFICSEGNPSLAKAGSGDVLAGMIAALLSQNYSAKEAAITAVCAHALSSSIENKSESFSLTPEKIIQNLSNL